MSHSRLIRTAAALSMLAVAAGACNRSKSTAPELQTTTGLQPRAQPLTVAGCLRSGVAENTFVLIASKTTGAMDTATYQLAARDDMNLRQYVGQQVEIAGTLRGEQQVASSGGATEAKPAKGTAGTPVVETKSEVDVKQLDVSSVKPTGNRCEG